jgi:tetratricopeptide (TPR) repeat protein
LAVKAALFSLAALAAAVLGGCARLSPEAATCKATASSDDQARAKLAACAKVIASGVQGDALEQALAGRGEAYRQAADFDHAIADFDQALRLNPRDLVALNGRGLAYLNQDKVDLALADFNAAIRVNPDDGDAFDHRGYIERTQRNYDAAIADESQAIELEPNAALSWANRGYDYAAKHQWDSAIADFDDALSRASDYGFALQGRADAERGKGDAKAAIKDYDAVLSDPHGANALADAEAVVALSAPGDPEALNTRCWVRGVLDTELPAALADCQQSIAARPNSAETLDSLAFIYFRQGRFDEAVKQYSTALAADPKQTPSLFMRGVAKLRVGDATGEDDIAAATLADKGVAAQFASWGVKP